MSAPPRMNLVAYHTSVALGRRSHWLPLRMFDWTPSLVCAVSSCPVWWPDSAHHYYIGMRFGGVSPILREQGIIQPVDAIGGDSNLPPDISLDAADDAPLFDAERLRG
jgi:hypothetical protein